MKIEHINRQIPPEAHTSMYNFHRYWARKTWNVVGNYIENYCPEGGIVLDPFVGSGVTAIEALRRNRKTIVCDLSPIATELTRLTIKNIAEIKLNETFEAIANDIKNELLDLYLSTCRGCKREIVIDCAIWQKDNCVDIRYKKCPYCGDERRKNTELNDFDKSLLKKIRDIKIVNWYPKNKLYYSNGEPFKKKEKYDSIDQMFSKRNLLALSVLMKRIEEIKDNNIKDYFLLAFTSMVHLCSKMNPISEEGHFTPFSSAWTQHSYWYPSNFYMEQNVWHKFESSITGHQGLLKAKRESNRYFKNIRFAKEYADVVEGDSNIYIYNGSCLDLLKKIKNKYRYGIMDYVFTDPPYDASIQYGELSYMWVAWIKKDKNYIEKIESDEIIRNERQKKSFEVYHNLLSSCFQDMYHVMKPGAYLTVTFHNPTFKVRNATIKAGVFAGFDFEKIHHQELARPSTKSLMQPFGSAQGDFYLRFKKESYGKEPIKTEILDKKRFAAIVEETATRVIAERGEPTPYTILLNAVDPELAKEGFFPELNSEIDINTVLKGLIGIKFKLVEDFIGSIKGQKWWFANPKSIKHLESTPLSERVEQTVLRKLQQRGKVTFTEIWDAVSSEFPNSLTSDQMSITEALKIYARPIGKAGYWMIRANLKEIVVNEKHTTIIAILSEIGKKMGFKIWIGKIEQTHILNCNYIKNIKSLKQYVDYVNLEKIENIVGNRDDVEGVDLLWIKNCKISKVFEVEYTTTITSGLNRCSNIDSQVPKILLIPKERTNQLIRKQKSPMFAERFKNDNWKVIYFEDLENEFIKHRSKTDIDKLTVEKLEIIESDNKKQKKQMELFS